MGTIKTPSRVGGDGGGKNTLYNKSTVSMAPSSAPPPPSLYFKDRKPVCVLRVVPSVVLPLRNLGLPSSAGCTWIARL